MSTLTYRETLDLLLNTSTTCTVMARSHISDGQQDAISGSRDHVRVPARCAVATPLHDGVRFRYLLTTHKVSFIPIAT